MTLWMTGPATIESHIAPGLRVGTEAVGHPDARSICSLLVLITDDVDAGHAQAAKKFVHYNSLPTYCIMLDHERVEGPADVALLGSEQEIEGRILQIKDAGAPDFCGHPFGNNEQMTCTRIFLAGLGGEF